VEVAHDEVGVGDVEVKRWRARMMPVSPPKRKVVRNPTVQSSGVSKDREPPHIVPIQLKNFTPVGTAMRKVMPEKKGGPRRR
jgi:hypothetical protein